MRATIERLIDLPVHRLADLVAESEAFGMRLVRRLVDEWTSGANRFERPGEAFFAAETEGKVVGVCGLNLDCYTTEPRTGRVRHLYVLMNYRRQGIGRRLVDEVIAAACGNFDRLRLRTDSVQASAFYAHLGFQPTLGDPNCTHAFELTPVSDRDCECG
jgi:ribosomal protein S18 acetylase RimI-like enzyme